MITAIKNIVKLLNEYNDLDYANQCIEDIKNGNFQIKIFDNLFKKNNQLKTLIVRNEIVKTRNNDINIVGIETTIERMSSYEYDVVKIVNISTNDRNYILYIGFDTFYLIGIIINKLLNSQKLISKEKKNIEQGYVITNKWYVPNSEDIISIKNYIKNINNC